MNRQRRIVKPILRGRGSRIQNVLGYAAIALTAAAHILSGPAARAASIHWNNPANGIWSAGPNWFGGIRPEADDGAVIDVQDITQPDYTVTLDISTTVFALNVSTLTGALEMTGVTFNVTDAAQLTAAPVTATNSNWTVGSLSSNTDLTLRALDANNVLTVNDAADNTVEMTLRVEKAQLISFFQSTANFNGGLTNSGVIASESNILTSGAGQALLNVTGTLANFGTIVRRAGPGSANFRIDADTLLNSGTIESEAGFIGFFRSGASYTNTGLISAPTNFMGVANFHNHAAGQIVGNGFFSATGTGPSSFTNDGTIHQTAGAVNLTSFETAVNNGTISATFVTINSSSPTSTITNNGTITGSIGATISAGKYIHKDGAVLSGGGALSLTGSIEMENGFAPGFNAVSYSAGITPAIVSGSGAFQMGANPSLQKNITFNAGTSLDFSGVATYTGGDPATPQILALNAPLVVGPGERFRMRALNGFARAELNAGLTNDGEFWMETTRTSSGGVGTFNSVVIGAGGLVNNGAFDARPKGGSFAGSRMVLANNVLNNGIIVNNDSALFDFRPAGASANIINAGLVDAVAGDIIFQFVSTFSNSGTIHAATGRTVTVSTGASTFTNETTGVISGPGTFIAQGTFIDHGTISPGDSPGMLTLQANSYTQAADGVIELEIAGLTAGTEYDRLILNATSATLNGLLRIKFVDDFAPQQNDVFELIVGNFTADFRDVEIVNLLPGFQYDAGFNNGAFRLTALTDGVFVPEPSAALLLLTAAAVAVAQVWRQFRLVVSGRKRNCRTL